MNVTENFQTKTYNQHIKKIHELKTRKNGSDFILHEKVLHNEISYAMCLKRGPILLYFSKMTKPLNVCLLPIPDQGGVQFTLLSAAAIVHQ